MAYIRTGIKGIKKKSNGKKPTIPYRSLTKARNRNISIVIARQAERKGLSPAHRKSLRRIAKQLRHKKR